MRSKIKGKNRVLDRKVHRLEEGDEEIDLKGVTINNCMQPAILFFPTPQIQAGCAALQNFIDIQLDSMIN